MRRRRVHRLDLRPSAPARARRRGHRARQAHLRRAGGEPAATSPSIATSASCAARSRIPQPVAGAIDAAAPEAIVNFAAETHVDRSIAEPDAFVPRTRSAPTCCWRRLARHGLRYLQVSTDEVYGSIEQGTFTEDSPLRPSSPYSATKTGADLLVQSYFHTYGLSAVICRGSNNYGPYQYPEKLIPLMILNALHGDPLPVYGDGMQVRNWIHASDFAARSATCSNTGPGRGVQRGRSRRAGQHRRGQTHRRADGRLGCADRARRRPTRPRPPLLALLREGSRARLEPRVSASARGSSRPSPGTARTPGGGSRSARATIASTTNASTGAHCTPEIFHLPASLTSEQRARTRVLPA